MRLSATSIAVLAALAAVSSPLFGQAELKFEPVQVVPPDIKFPAIKEVPVVKASKARIKDEELVLGVVVKGKARAYPINMLTQPTREIFNDTLGERPLAATW